jgi:hypothetical protein
MVLRCYRKQELEHSVCSVCDALQIQRPIDTLSGGQIRTQLQERGNAKY